MFVFVWKTKEKIDDIVLAKGFLEDLGDVIMNLVLKKVLMTLRHAVHIRPSMNKPVNAIVRQPHHQSGDSHGQEKFLPPSTDNQPHNYNRQTHTHTEK